MEELNSEVKDGSCLEDETWNIQSHGRLAPSRWRHLGSLVSARESKTSETRESLVDSRVSKLPWRRDRPPTPIFSGFPGVSDSKRICLQCRRPGFGPCVGRIPRRRAWQPTPVFLPGESHGQRSLAGYSPWGGKESDTAERLSTAQMYIYIYIYNVYTYI